ncbi:MAG: hypothetical protein ACXW36_11175 [Nitrospira sp.]
MSEAPQYASQALFLSDGLAASPTPGALLIGDAEECAQFAIAMQTRGIPVTTSSSELLRLEPQAVREMDPANAEGLLSQVVARGAWTYCADLHTYLDSPGGRALLSALCNRIVKGDLPCVLAGTTLLGAQRLAEEAFRVRGLLPAFDLSVTPMHGAGALGYIYVRVPGISLEDSGWLVQVRLMLLSDVRANPQVGDDRDTQDALRLVDGMLGTGSRERPMGLQVSFDVKAFTGNQHAAAFRAAELVARRIVGRPLQPNEAVEASRGVCCG